MARVHTSDHAFRNAAGARVSHLDDALAYIALGWHVFPVGPSKEPRTQHGHLDATTDESIVRGHWSRFPDDNIGIHLARSGLCAVDFDPRNGEDALAEAEARLGALPRRCMQGTPAGGVHVVMRLLEARRPRGRAVIDGERIRGLDFKQNGYILVEPSKRADGCGYEWVAFDPDVADVPAAWVDVLYHPDAGDASAPDFAPDGWDACSDTEISRGDSDRLRAHLRALGSRGENRNTTFRAVSAIFHDWGLSVEAGWPYLVEWNDASGKPHPENELHRQVHRVAGREHSGGRGRARRDIPIGMQVERAAVFSSEDDEEEPARSAAHPDRDVVRDLHAERVERATEDNFPVSGGLPARPSVAMVDVEATAKFAARKWARGKPHEIAAAKMVSAALSGRWQSPPDEDRAVAVARLASALVAAAPDAADHQLAALIPDGDAAAAVASARESPVVALARVDGGPRALVPVGEICPEDWGTDSWELETFGPRAGLPRGSSQVNCVLALHRLGYSYHRDAFASRDWVETPGEEPGDPRERSAVDDGHVSRTMLLAERTFGFRADLALLHAVVDDLLAAAARHPLLEYLADVEATWDLVPRVDAFLVDYAGAEDTPYSRAVARNLLVGAVRRAREPGCKHDEMPVLEGPQGCGKSSLLRIMAVEESWFTDDVPLGARSREAIEHLEGRWIVEASELRGMRDRDLDALKAFCTRQVDKGRRAYERRPVEVPRTCVFAGTTNEDTYLRDHTGDRRFLPVAVGEVDLEALRRDRDQIWAEAAARQSAGETGAVPVDVRPAAAEAQAERREVDPWVDALSEKLGDAVGLLPLTSAWTLLALAPADMTADRRSRVTRAMQSLGWEKTRRRRDDGRCWYYERGATAAERDVPLVVDHAGRVKIAAPMK